MGRNKKKYHYVYLLENTTDYRLYFGIRSSNVPPDEDDYMGSYTDESYNPTDKTILACFFSREDAYTYEDFLIELWDAARNPLFVNKAARTSRSFTTYGRVLGSRSSNKRNPRGYFLGRTHTPAAKSKLRKAHLGLTHSEETRRRISKAIIGTLNPKNKKVYSIINEQGIIHTGNPSELTRVLKTNRGAMGRLISGKLRRVRGYMLLEVYHANPIFNLRIGETKDLQIYTIKNGENLNKSGNRGQLAQFLKVKPGDFGKLLSGKRKSIYGWTLVRCP